MQKGGLMGKGDASSLIMLNLWTIHVDIAHRQLDMCFHLLGRGQSWRYSFGVHQHINLI